VVEGKNMGESLAEGRICVVTGATQGIGRAVALYLAESGASGIVICGRSSEKGEEVARAIEAAGCECEFVRADLTVEADCRQVVRRCDERFGRLDGLVNAAGTTERGGIEDTTVGQWNRIFALNVTAPFILIQDAVSLMRRTKSRGSIVNIISDTSHGGPPYLTAYSASKAALAALTRNVANAVRFDRIRVNGLNIGWTLTPNEDRVQKAMGKGDDWLKKAESQQPFGRILRPEDTAYLVAHLLSDRAEMMTGSVIDFNQVVIGTWE